MKRFTVFPCLLVLAFIQSASAWCGDGSILLIDWVAKSNIASDKEGEYLDAKRDYEQAEGTWRGWQDALELVSAQKETAETVLVDHDRSCGQCGDLGSRCDQGQALYDNYRSLVQQTDHAELMEAAAYELYCQAYQAKFEALTEWNDALIESEAAHGAFWAHVNGGEPGGAPCPDCNQE